MDKPSRLNVTSSGRSDFSFSDWSSAGVYIVITGAYLGCSVGCYYTLYYYVTFGYSSYASPKVIFLATEGDSLVLKSDWRCDAKLLLSLNRSYKGECIDLFLSVRFPTTPLWTFFLILIPLCEVTCLISPFSNNITSSQALALLIS
jgi:hypothetical protein